MLHPVCVKALWYHACVCFQQDAIMTRVDAVSGGQAGQSGHSVRWPAAAAVALAIKVVSASAFITPIIIIIIIMRSSSVYPVRVYRLSRGPVIPRSSLVTSVKVRCGGVLWGGSATMFLCFFPFGMDREAGVIAHSQLRGPATKHECASQYIVSVNGWCATLHCG